MYPQMPQGKAIGFKPLAEEWNYYSIDDGYVLGLRVVVTKLMKTGQTDPTGLPMYIVQSQPLIQVLTPDEYKSITSGSSISK